MANASRRRQSSVQLATLWPPRPDAPIVSVKILFATSNPHKVDEVRAILSPRSIEVVDLASWPEVPEPVEDADTFEGNARIKAVAYARAIGMRCLAEDSGLEVDALGGEPGVHSARYAGNQGTRTERDRANNLKLLARVASMSTDQRMARFVCAMCLAEPDGTIVAEARGTYEGQITSEPRGGNGFGYDPLLFLPDVGKTSAELSSEEKNARSHRGAAMRSMLEKILDRR